MYVPLDAHLRNTARPVAQLRRVDAPLTRDLIDRRELRQTVHCRANHVVRVRRAEALRENVGDADTLLHRANCTTSDHAGSRCGRLHPHFTSAVLAGDFVRNRRAGERNAHEVATRRLDGLADRLGHFVRLAGCEAHLPLSVADGDERVEAEATTTLHDLGHAGDRDHVLDQIRAFTATSAAAAVATTAAATAATTAI